MWTTFTATLQLTTNGCSRTRLSAARANSVLLRREAGRCWKECSALSSLGLPSLTVPVASARTRWPWPAGASPSLPLMEARAWSPRRAVDRRSTTSRDLSRQVPGPFDLVVCLGNSIVHADTRAGLVDAVQGMRAVLGPGGTLVVDSRNWERLYSLRPRIVPARRVIGRRGLRCSSLYIWTIPDELDEPCRAEIVLLFEDADSALTGHRRHVIDFGCGSFEVS